MTLITLSGYRNETLFGLKINHIISLVGTIINYLLTTVNFYDIKIVENLADDKVIFSELVRISLFELYLVKLKTPKEKNIKILLECNKGASRTRNTIENVFAQMKSNL
jgi:hypothetical protein